MMRTRTRILIAGVVAIFVGLLIDFAAACNRHVAEKAALAGYGCKPGCACQCNRPGCGCHEGTVKPKPTGRIGNG